MLHNCLLRPEHHPFLPLPSFLPQVCRVQSYVDALDSLKARNANKFNPFGSVGGTGTGTGSAVSVTTEWETFDSDVGIANAAASSLSSSTKVTQDWEQFD